MRLWHKNGVTDKYSQKKTISPLNSQKLRALALFYVGKYATTRKKLAQYLTRKINERGWDDDDPPLIDEIVHEFTEVGYINDALFAASKARSMVNRGYGMKKLQQEIW